MAKLPKTVKLSIEIVYDFKGQLLAEYLEAIDDYPDTREARLAFALDRFAPTNWRETLDPKAKLSFSVMKEEKK